MVTRFHVVKEHRKYIMMALVTPQRIIAGVLAAGFVLSAFAAAFADTIGYVNLDRVIGGYDKAQTVLADVKVREAELRKMQADFVKQLEQSRKSNTKSPVTADALEKQLRDQLQARVGEYRDWATSKQKEIDDEINAAIKQVATQKSIDVVVNEQAVLMGGTNITNEVLTRLNKGGK